MLNNHKTGIDAVKTAFRLQTCEYVGSAAFDMWRGATESGNRIEIHLAQEDGALWEVELRDTIRLTVCYDDELIFENDDDCWACYHDGQGPIKEMAHGLFCLGFSEPLIKRLLGVEFTAHQKLEWSLEYAERWGEGEAS